MMFIKTDDGYHLCSDRNTDDALAALRQAERLEPLSAATACDFGLISYWTRRYAKLSMRATERWTYIPPLLAHMFLWHGLMPRKAIAKRQSRFASKRACSSVDAHFWGNCWRRWAIVMAGAGSWPRQKPCSTNLGNLAVNTKSPPMMLRRSTQG
jgi:hypothetical protein